jgi:hypothetical protein
MTDQIKKEFESALGHLLNVAARADLAGYIESTERVFALFEAQSKPEGWIPVSERLPDEGRAVLIVADGWVKMGWRNGEWIDWDGDECVVTHWMPLPAPPTQTDEQR